LTVPVFFAVGLDAFVDVDIFFDEVHLFFKKCVDFLKLARLFLQFLFDFRAFENIF